MKYAKPEVAVIGSAVKTIQTTSHAKGIVQLDSNVARRPQPSTGAYEADE
jgi:hypothetical protein